MTDPGKKLPAVLQMQRDVQAFRELEDYRRWLVIEIAKVFGCTTTHYREDRA